MDSDNIYLDNLFNGLSSIYRNDNGMLNSNMFIIDNSYAEVFSDVQRKINQVSNNTYIATAEQAALEANFGTLINFPMPPRLNTVNQGGEIYRAMLKAMFKVFQSGATTASMQQALGTAVSYLTVDPNTTAAEQVVNYTTLYVTTSGISLAYPAVQASGGNILGPARTGTAASGDIAFFPSDLIVTNYNPTTNTISFTGTVNTGTNYAIFYNRDNTAYNGTNWVNLTNPTGLAINPLDLIGDPIPSYDNPIFSYWWNTYNTDGNGIIIDQFALSGTDSSLVWRLPEKTIAYTSPFTGRPVTQTVDFYNLTGTAYNIDIVTPSNPDTLFNDVPQNYYSDVSSNFNNYYIRYSANNNSTQPALFPFLGSLPTFTKYYNSISFFSSNFGNLDFFEKGSNFDVNNLLGTGTINAWINVPNVNGAYNLNNTNIVQRNYSLHEDILYFNNFEDGTLSRVSSTNWSGTRISDEVGVPLYQKEDCLMVFGLESGVSISTSPILNAATTSQGNHIEIDFYDGFNSGTQTLMDIVQTGTAGQYNRFRFGIDYDSVISSSDPFSNSLSSGFVETYFSSQQSVSHAINLTGSYTYTTGTNTNTIFSNQSLYATGNMSFINNAYPALVQNADNLLIQFDYQGGNLFVALASIEPAGISNGEAWYSTLWNQIFVSNGQLGHGGSALGTFISNPHGAPVTSFNGGGGLFGIPVSSGIHTLQLLNNGNAIFDGATIPHAVPWDNLGTLGTAHSTNGVVAPYNEINAGDPLSVSVTVNSGTSILHYEFGNSTLRSQYLQTQSTGISQYPYFYQNFTASGQSIVAKNYLSQLPREEGWHTLTVDFTTNYTCLNASMDSNQFLNLNLPFSGNIASTSGISMITNTNYPLQEYSYFDNVTVSYYDPTKVLPLYNLTPNLAQDWEGSALSQSTILDNKFFQFDPQTNFQFEVIIKGLDPNFIFIINNIVAKLKPAHTIAITIFEQTQTLDTSVQLPVISNTGTNWETGNLNNNIIVEITGQSVVPTNGLPVYITISGT